MAGKQEPVGYSGVGGLWWGSVPSGRLVFTWGKTGTVVYVLGGGCKSCN